MNTGHSLKGWCHLVGKTQFKALAAVHPGFVLQHCRNFFGGFSGFLCISRDKNGFNLVEKIRIVAHIARVTTSKPPGLMDHHHRVFRHDDRIAYHRNHRGHGGRQTVDMYGNRRAVVLQRVINSNSVEDITTGRVDIKVDVGDVPKCPEIIDELFRRYAPVPDFVINKNVGLTVIAGLHAEPRITFCAGFRTVARPVLWLRHWCLLYHWRGRCQTPGPVHGSRQPPLYGVT